MLGIEIKRNHTTKPLPAKCPKCGADLDAIVKAMKGRLRETDLTNLSIEFERCETCQHYVYARMLGEELFAAYLYQYDKKDKRNEQP